MTKHDLNTKHTKTDKDSAHGPHKESLSWTHNDLPWLVLCDLFVISERLVNKCFVTQKVFQCSFHFLWSLDLLGPAAGVTSKPALWLQGVLSWTVWVVGFRWNLRNVIYRTLKMWSIRLLFQCKCCRLKPSWFICMMSPWEGWLCETSLSHLTFARQLFFYWWLINIHVFNDLVLGKGEAVVYFTAYCGDFEHQQQLFASQNNVNTFLSFLVVLSALQNPKCSHLCRAARPHLSYGD